MIKGFKVLVFSLLILGFASCESNCIRGRVKEISESSNDVTVFKYKNHEYISFRMNLDRNGFVHDPDCSFCKNK